MPATAPEPMIKGAAVRPFMVRYAERYGEARLTADVRRLSDEKQRWFEPRNPGLGLLVSTWYPAPVLHSLLDEMTRDMLAPERTALAREGARAVIASTLKGVYKVLFETMMSTERYRKNAQKLFSRYYNTGVMTKIASTPIQHVSTIQGWTGHHPVLCEMILFTGESVYAAMGCRDLTLKRTECISKGADRCTFVIGWS